MALTERVNIVLLSTAGGLATKKVVDKGTTLKDIMEECVDIVDNYAVRVNSKIETGDYTVRDGDVVAYEPVKIGGACS